MKILLKKFNKTKLSIRLIYIFVFLLFLVSYGSLFRSLLLLNNIETGLRIIVLCVLGILLLLYGFFCLLLLLTKKHKSVIAFSFIIMLIASFSLIGSLAINKMYNLLDSISKDKLVYTTNLITLNKTDFNNNKNFKVGMINQETDVEGSVLPYEMIKDKKLNVTVEKYDTYFELLEKLYDGSLNGIFITSNYVVMYEGYESYENIGKDTKVVYEYSKEMKNQDYIKSSGSVENPFTVLIMGVDSTSDKLNANAAFNGDTLMLITFNPHTLNATVFSIPRDTYVPIACLKNGGSSKINSSAAYGSQCVINTVQNLVDINIDYYVKINFKGVVDLVNALGGIDITVPDKIDFCEQNSKRSFKKENLQCIKSGFQHMNGEQALAFARHRKTLPAGDFQRVQHQQLVVEAIANSAKSLSSINDFYAILDAISINMDTNMSTNEMLNLYNVGKNMIFGANSGSMINIQKTYLTGYDLTMYVNNLKSRVYTFQYYEQSLEEIKDALKITLEKKQPTPVKTFNFSVNEEYKIPVIGKKYYTVQRNETIPDFTDKSLSYVKNWCESRNITVMPSYVYQGTSGYDRNKPDETVIKQSVKRGMLVKDITSITVNVIKHPGAPTTTTTRPSSTKPTTTKSPTTTTTKKTDIVDIIGPGENDDNNNDTNDDNSQEE